MPMSRSPPSTSTTLPHKYPSNPDIHETLYSSDSNFINLRKRKQPDNDLNPAYEAFEQKIDEKLNLWKNQLDATITASIKNTMHPLIIQEVEKISLSMKSMFKEFSERLDTFDKSLTYAMERQDSFDHRLEQVESKLRETHDVESQISLLQDKIDSMEQQARLYNIEIANLPERRDENLLAIVEKIGSIVKHPIHASSIVSAHRVPHMDNKNKRPKNIIVRFTTKIIRDNFITAARAVRGLKSDQLLLSGTVQNVYINEHLTAKNKQLFRKCREEATKHNFKYVWIKHGTVLVRQTDSSNIFAVRSEQDIKKIKS